MRIAKALIYDADGYALVLRRSSTHPYYAYQPDLPGGIIERGEEYEEGLVRELSEEAGITITPNQLRLLDTREGLTVSTKRLYEARLDHHPHVTLSWEHDRYEWVAPDDMHDALESRDSFITFAQKYVAKQ